jgi:hypothetical protein
MLAAVAFFGVTGRRCFELPEECSLNEQLGAGEHPRNQLLRSIDSTRIFDSITPAGRRLAGLK